MTHHLLSKDKYSYLITEDQREVLERLTSEVVYCRGKGKSQEMFDQTQSDLTAFMRNQTSLYSSFNGRTAGTTAEARRRYQVERRDDCSFE